MLRHLGQAGRGGQSYEEETPITFDLLTPGEENSTMFPPAFVLLDGSGLGE